MAHRLRGSKKLLIKVKAILVMCAVLTLAGCAKSKWEGESSICDADIFSLGRDTYMADGGCGHEYELKHAAIFCRRQGKEILVDHIDHSAGGYVAFKCLSENDPDYERPVYKRSPDIVVENN